MSVRRNSLPLAWLLVGLVICACSERAEPTVPLDGGDVTEVVIRDFAFSAPTITIDRGTSVRWRNTTGTFHTVTPNGHQAFANRQTAAQGQTFETRFDTPGRYLYYCEPHRSLGMTGEIVVR
ncbi:MAG: plastocyanin [Geminicoccaceae bacterium]|nr:plastocyanin [Geminicoccaceae bacterium]